MSTEIKLIELVKEPGIADLKGKAKMYFAKAYKHEIMGETAEAERCLALAVEAEQNEQS